MAQSRRLFAVFDSESTLALGDGTAQLVVVGVDLLNLFVYTFDMLRERQPDPSPGRGCRFGGVGVQKLLKHCLLARPCDIPHEAGELSLGRDGPQASIIRIQGLQLVSRLSEDIVKPGLGLLMVLLETPDVRFMVPNCDLRSFLDGSLVFKAPLGLLGQRLRGPPDGDGLVATGAE